MQNLQDDRKIATVFNSARTQAFIQQTGLTEGEAKAVITYTAINYKYINPATANQKDKPAEFDETTKKYKPEQVDLYKVMEGRKAKGEDTREMESDLDDYKQMGWLDADNRLNFNNVAKADRDAFAEAVKKYKRKDWMDAQNRLRSIEGEKLDGKDATRVCAPEIRRGTKSEPLRRRRAGCRDDHGGVQEIAEVFGSTLPRAQNDPECIRLAVCV